MPIDRLTSARHLDFRPRGDVFPSPADWRDCVVYQILLDRFDDGGDHPPFDPDKTPRGRDQDQGWHFQGGTLKGLERRLDYVRGLGANALWISCPLKQRAGEQTYHGYAVQDFLSIDPRFGTTDDLRSLVKSAHDRGMWVILDVVIDHTADVFTYAQEGQVVYENGEQFDFGRWCDGGDKNPADFGPDDAIWPIEFQHPDAFVRQGEMGDVTNTSAAEAKDGDFMSLKKLDLTRPEVLSAILNCYKHWIAVADVDGFRIDALRHVRHPAASDFVHAIREFALSIGKANFMQVGEVADADEEMRRYVGTNVELPEPLRDPGSDPDGTGDYPQLDAVIDFELHRRIIPVLLGETPATELEELWEKRRKFYRDPGEAGRYYLAYLENHDQGGRDRHRLLSGTFEQHPDGYDRPGGDPRLAVMSYAVLLCGQGVPCMYYGTEQGFDGGSADSDAYVREAMFGGKWGPFDTTGASFFDDEHPIYKQIRTICDIRRDEPALRYGRVYLRPTSGDGVHFGPPEHAGPFAFARVLDVTEIVVAANPTPEEVDVCVGVDAALNPPGYQVRNCLASAWRGEIEQTDEGQAFVRLTLPPRGVAVLRLSVN